MLRFLRIRTLKGYYFLTQIIRIVIYISNCKETKKLNFNLYVLNQTLDCIYTLTSRIINYSNK